jgi:hypothetical protein
MTVEKETVNTENPYFDIPALNILEQRFIQKLANESDLERLDQFMNGLGFKDYILGKFKSKGILSYEEYIISRNDPNDPNRKVVSNTLLGVILGSINALKKILTNN